jgi:hypothetical protein
VRGQGWHLPSERGPRAQAVEPSQQGHADGQSPATDAALVMVRLVVVLLVLLLLLLLLLPSLLLLAALSATRHYPPPAACHALNGRGRRCGSTDACARGRHRLSRRVPASRCPPPTVRRRGCRVEVRVLGKGWARPGRGEAPAVRRRGDRGTGGCSSARLRPAPCSTGERVY